MKTINLTKDGFSAIKIMVNKSNHLSEILDTSNTGENFFWDWELKTNRFVHQINLPEDRLELLKFLFEVEIKHLFTKGVDVRVCENAEKMVKRIVKAIK